ncbi:MAG: hypothetical protein WDZ74_00980 [Candidatus Paceibacterota bacterium]
MRKLRKSNTTRAKPTKGVFSFLRRKKSQKARVTKERVTLKPSDLRRRKFVKKRNRLLTFFIGLAILISTLVFALWYFAHSESLTIRTIDIRNDGRTNTEEIEALVRETLEEGKNRFFPTTNSIFVPIRKLEQSLADSFVRIERANVLRKGFDELIVVIEERAPAYIYCEDNDTLQNGRYVGECFFADVTGVIYSRAPYLPKSEFLIIYLQPLTDDDYFGNIPLAPEELFELVELTEILKREDLGVGVIRLIDEKTLDVGTGKSFSLLLEIDDDYTDELERLFSALEAKIFEEGRTLRDVYQFDLRFGRKVFYRYNESPATENFQ